MNDFTPEILMRNHDANLRGVAVVVDEIMGLFNTINRYNNSSFVQQMLSAHNGLPVDVSRCNLDCPLRIDYLAYRLWELSRLVLCMNFMIWDSRRMVFLTVF